MHTGFAPYRGVCAFPVYTAQAPGCSIWSGPCIECSSSFQVLHESADSVAPAFCASPAWAVQAARGLGALSLNVARLFLPLPQCLPPVGCLWLVFVQSSLPLATTLLAADVDHPESQEFFRQEPGAGLQFGRGRLLWGWVCPFPLPPASYLQWGWAGSSLEFLSPFVLRTDAVCSGWLIFSLAMPQFKKAPSDCSQGLRAQSFP